MKKTLLVLSTLAIGIGSHIQVQADDIESIVVTGSRIVESIDEVPASITVIDKKAIQQQLKISSDIQSLLSMHVPGISTSTGTSSNFGQTLRGRAALVMIDGVPQSTPLRNGALDVKTLDPSVIERIEVIQGATSIYGNGAAGGIINYITKKTNSSDTFNLDTNISTRFSTVKLEDSFGEKITSTASGAVDNLSYVISVSVEENGVLRDAEGDALGTQYGLSEGKTDNYFTKLNYQFDSDKSVGFTYNYYESQQDTNWIDVIGDINKGEKTYAINDPENRPPNAAPQGPRGNHNFQLKYTDTEIFANTLLDFDAYKQTIENVFFYSTRLGNVDLGVEGGQSLIKSKKEGLRATFNTGIEFSNNIDATFIYGIDALNDVTSQPLVDGRIWVPEMDMDNLAGFLQSKWIFNDDIVVKAGLRKEDIEIKVNDYNTLKLCTSPTVCSVPLAVTGDTIDFNATTYNLGLRYNAFQKFTPYLSYSEGADIPDLGSLLRSATVNDIALIHTEAAIIKSIEAGFVTQFDKLRFELLAYRSKSDLGSKSTLDKNTGIYITKRAPQKIWGYEGVVNYPISDNIDIRATYGYVEGKHTLSDEYIGGRQVSAPKGTIVANWRPTENLNLLLSYLHVGDRNRFERNDEGNYSGDEGAVKGYNIVNFSGSYEFEKWSIFAGIENLFNKDYFPARSQALTYSAFNVKGIGTTVNLGIKFSI
ncbi:TonB-dependent receptor [Thalassotalea ganghwensis]